MNKPNLWYLTTDDLNGATTAVLAQRQGVPLEVVEPRDLPRFEREEAEVVLDWDYLPEEECDHLLNGSPNRVVAVHGYNLPAWASFLVRRGIVVSSRLDEHVFQALAGRRTAV